MNGIGAGRIAIATVLSCIWIACNAASLTADIETLKEAGLHRQAVERLQEVESSSAHYAEALRLLGGLYLVGKGVDRDETEAAELFRESARLGNAEAAYELGQCYERGTGVVQSAEAAFNWYDRAAEMSPRAALRYAEIALANKDMENLKLRHDPVGRIRFAAREGNARAELVLGTLILRNEIEPKPGEDAEELIARAARSLPKAKTALGAVAHKQGEIEKARNLFRKALDEGDSEAAAYLGLYAEMGIDEPIDRKKAYGLYEEAKSVIWAIEGKRRIEERQRSIEIFGLKMYGTARAEILEHLNSMNIPRVGGEGYFDAFDVTRAMGGRRSVLTVAYAPGVPGFVAELNYRFPVAERRTIRRQTEELIDSLKAEYGSPASNVRSQGNTLAKWRKESVRISLRAMPKEDLIDVTYRFSPFSEELARYVEERERQMTGEVKDAL